jgi:tetrahydromethanopterin S-methyltransferase subunit H
LKKECENMFSFTKKQQVLRIGTVAIGGQPGQHPTTLIGGLFFSGIPNYIQAAKDIETMFSISEKTKNPAIIDFFVKKSEYCDKIISFISKTIPEKHPFSIDVTDPKVKVQILEKLDEVGLLQQTIYNSIHVGITKEEFEALIHHPPYAAILVSFNPKDTSPDGKIEVLETGANITDQGLLKITEKCGIKNIMIDTAALAPGHNSGASIAAIPVIKEEYGFPTGCAIHNVVEKSTWLSDFTIAKDTIDVASNINIPLFGGDFAIFGAIKHAPLVFPVMAWQDILISEYVESYFGVSPDEGHPRRKFFQ